MGPLAYRVVFLEDRKKERQRNSLPPVPRSMEHLDLLYCQFSIFIVTPIGQSLSWMIGNPCAFISSSLVEGLPEGACMMCHITSSSQVYGCHAQETYLTPTMQHSSGMMSLMLCWRRTWRQYWRPCLSSPLEGEGGSWGNVLLMRPQIWTVHRCFKLNISLRLHVCPLRGDLVFNFNPLGTCSIQFSCLHCYIARLFNLFPKIVPSRWQTNFYKQEKKQKVISSLLKKSLPFVSRQGMFTIANTPYLMSDIFTVACISAVPWTIKTQDEVAVASTVHDVISCHTLSTMKMVH